MRSITLRRMVLLALILVGASLVQGEPRLGRLKVSIVNGTTGAPGEANSVTLFKLASGMEPIVTLGRASAEITMDDIDVDSTVPYLLQVTAGGVSYNHPVEFRRNASVETQVTVYETTRDESNLEVKSARYLLRREHDVLRVDKLFVVENHSNPKKTFYDPQGTFRFHIPAGLLGSSSVYASSASGMPVPQSASPLADGSGYVVSTAFKPGTTDITVAYSVDYAAGVYDLHEWAFYPLPQLLALLTPADVEIEGKGWENLTPHPESRFVVLRQRALAVGDNIELKLAGGSEQVASGGPVNADSAPAHGTVTQLSDPTRYRMWIIVLLMAAALAYGLLTATARTPERREKPVNEA